MRTLMLLLSICVAFPAEATPQTNTSAPEQTPPSVPPALIVDVTVKKVSLPASLRQSPYDPSRPVVVVVDKTNHRTHVLQLQGSADAPELVEVLAIPNATGKRSTPTPSGRTTVAMKELDPVWTPPKSIDPKQRSVAPYSKTKKNPLGVAWIGLNKGSIGLHGTNAPKQIGRSVSHGCIRHHNEDVLKLYDQVQVGTPVYLLSRFEGAAILVADLKVTTSGTKP